MINRNVQYFETIVPERYKIGDVIDVDLNGHRGEVVDKRLAGGGFSMIGYIEVEKDDDKSVKKVKKTKPINDFLDDLHDLVANYNILNEKGLDVKVNKGHFGHIKSIEVVWKTYDEENKLK